MALENILSQEIVQKLGWTLLHFVWQAAAAALLLTILLAVLRKSSANLRYIVACAAMGLIVLLPIVTMQLIPVSTPQPIAGIEPAPAPVMVTMPPITEKTPQASVVEYEESAQPESVSPAPAAPWKQRAVDRLEPALPYLVSGWLLGVFGLSLWHLGGWAQLQRLRKKLVRPVDASLYARLRRLSERLRVKQAVQLVESALVQVPTVIGWLRPVILLPASALTGLSSEQLEALLAHELAHIRRHDYLINILQTVVETLGFYHPAVWWVSHKIRVERENCCDDLAVSISGDRISYAKALTSMEEIRGRRGELAVAASGGNLFGRIRRLLGKEASDSSRASWIPSVITILLIAIIAIPTTLALTAQNKTGHSAKSLLDKMLEHRSRVKNLQYAAENNIWRDLAAEQAMIEEQIKSMRESGISERDLERIRQSRTEAPESCYQILKCTIDDEEHVKIEQTNGNYDSSGKKMPGENRYIWAWNGILATDFIQQRGLPASATIRDTPRVATKLAHPWRSFTGIFCGFLEETIAAEQPVSVEKLKDGTYRVAFDYKTSSYTAILDPSKGYTCSLQETYNQQGQLNSHTTATYEKVAEDIWFPVSGQRQEYTPEGAVRYRSITKLSQIKINDQAFNAGYFDVDMPEGTAVRDQVQNKQYVVGAKREYDLDKPQKPSAEEEQVDPNSWQEKFYSLYRLEDGQVLKRIAPPFIPERTAYMKSIQPGRYSPNTPLHLVKQYFNWDGKLSIRGASLGSSIPRLNSILRSVIGLGNRQYDIPTQILSADMSGDWIVRKDTPKEELLQALEQIVKDETSRDIDFVKKKVETDVIIVKGKYNFQLLPNITDGQYVLISTNNTDTYTGGGGGSGTLDKFLKWVGNRVGMNVIDKTESEDVELSWRNHYSSELSRLNHDTEPYNDRLNLLLKNLSLQTGLTFKKEAATVEKWFIAENGTIKANRETIVPVESDKGSIEGRIIDINTGKGIAGVQLAAVPNSSPELSDRFVCTSAEDGTFAIGGLQSGEYLLQGNFPSMDVDVVSGRSTNDVLIGVDRRTAAVAPKETTAEQQHGGQIIIGMRVIEIPANVMKDVFEPNESLSSGLLVRPGHEIAGRLLTLLQEQKDAKQLTYPQVLMMNNGNPAIIMINKEKVYTGGYESAEGKPGKLTAQPKILEAGWKYKIKAKILESGEKVHIELTAKQQKPVFETLQYRPGYDYQIPSPPEIFVTEMTPNNGEPVVICRQKRGEPAFCLIVTASVIVPEPLPEPLLGKKLPEPENIQNIDSLKQAEGKPTLICFWDMNQRPSRDIIEELAKREKELEAKGIVVLLIHTSDFEPVKLKEWLDSRKIPFACGNIEGDAGKVLSHWGVRAQPWLILTDENRIIRAEGFNIEQLDEKLQEASKLTANRIRFVHFPKNRSLGILYTRDSGIEGRESWQGWEELGQARGEISISDGKELRLMISDNNYQHFAELASLGANDIQNLYIRYRNLQDSDLVHLKGLTGLQSLTLSSGSSVYTCPMNGEGLVNLSNMESLRVLMIQFTSIRDENLAHLKHLTSLENLSIWNAEELTGKGLSYLRDISSLRKLSFYMVPIEDFGIENLKGMDQLESLSLQYTKVTDEGLIHLKGLTGLKDLVLPPDTTDDGLAKLQGLSSLEELYISDTKVTEDGLSHLKGLSGLKSLSVGGRNMNGRGLRHLHDLPQLKELSIFMNKMDDEGMRGLKYLTAVTSLNLERTQVSDAGLANIEGLTALKYLCLANTAITDAGLVYLKDLTSLETLRLDRSLISDAGLANLQNLASLRTLWLQGTDVTDAGLMYLKGLQSLKELYLGYTQVSDAGLVNLKELHSLQHLFLGGTNVSGEGLVHLKGLKSLRTLVICVNTLSEEGVGHLKEMTWLHELTLGEGSVSEATVANLRNALPDCVINVQEVISPPPKPEPIPPSLLGKPLSGMKDFGIDQLSAEVGDKMILGCFFDIEQRPSRNFIGELTRRENELAKKNVAVYLVHTSKVEPAKLKEWLDNQNVQFVCGNIEGDAKEVLLAWGVQAQPWLILTDQKGVVRAEGFSLEQLDEKLQEKDSDVSLEEERSRDNLLAKSAAPSGVDKSVVKVDLSVVEVFSDSKFDRETTVLIENLLGGKITLPDSPDVADLLKKAASATTAVKDESADDKRITHEQFNVLFDMLISRGYVKILMNPTLEVFDGGTAKIRSEQKIPSIQDSLKNLIQITPHVSKDDNLILLQFEAILHQKSMSQSNEQTLIINKLEISTQVRLSPGESGIIGGMKQTGLITGPVKDAKNSEPPATETLFILTPTIVETAGNQQNEEMVTRVYDISDLVHIGERISRGKVDVMMGGSDNSLGSSVNIPDQAIVNEAQNIVNLIMQTADPNSWYENDPNARGIITPFPAARPRKLAIYQTLPAHQQIEKFLESRREQTDTTQISIELYYLYTNVEFLDEVRDSLDIEFTSDTFLDDKQVETLLRASQKKRDIKSMMPPGVMVLNNETARFKMVRQSFMSFLDYSEPNNVSQPSTPVPVDTFCRITPRIEDNKNIIIDFVQDIPGLQERIIYDRRETGQSYTETTSITNKRIPKNKTFAFICDIIKFDQDNQTALPARKKTLLVLIKPTIIVQEEMPRSNAAAMILNSRRSEGYTDEQADETIYPKPMPEKRPGTGKSQILIDTKILTVSDEFMNYIGLDPNSVANSKGWSDYLVHSTDDSASFIVDHLHEDLLLRTVAARMQTHKDIKMLQKPQVLALSGKKFEIHIPQSKSGYYMLRAPIEPNGSSEEPESESNRTKLGTTIRLTPNLTPDRKNVELDFEWEYRRLRGFKEHIGPDGNVQKVPQTDVDRIKTPCTVPDGKTLFITGKKITEQKKKEPGKSGLAGLPLIGGLFSSPTKTEETMNLLILVKPVINPPKIVQAPRKTVPPPPLDPNDPLIKKLEEKFKRADEQK